MFPSIGECMDFFGDVGTPLDVFYRVKGFDLKQWEEMRRRGDILLGRFLHGRVRYVQSKDAPMYASIYRCNSLRDIDKRILSLISQSEGLSLRQLVPLLDIPKDDIKESIDRLDRNMYVVRKFEEKEEWSSENIYIRYDPPAFEGDAQTEIVRRFVRAYGPVSLYAITSYTQLPVTAVTAILRDLPLQTITVGEGREEMYLFSDEMEDLNSPSKVEERVRILSLYDPSVQTLWAAISSKYGDRWIYPIVRGGRLIGAAEKWNMSGCIEIRDLDIEDASLLPQVLQALDEFMRFYDMMGYDIVRIRNVLENEAENMPDDLSEVLEGHGYQRIGDMFAKGNMIPHHYPWEHIVDYIARKQRIPAELRYPSIPEALKTRGGFRSDAEASLRCQVRVPLKRMFDQGLVVRIQALPEYITYCTVEHASLCRKAKSHVQTEVMGTLMKILHHKKAVTRSELFDLSPVGHHSTYQALRALQAASMIYTDGSKRIHAVPDLEMSAEEARREIVRVAFRNFGMFSAENLSRFLKYEFPMKEVRSVLSDLEKEGFLTKGFLVEGDDTVHWMVREDVDLVRGDIPSEGFVLSPDDNLHFYLQPWIRSSLGGSYYTVVMDGGMAIGSFRGRLRGRDLQIHDFVGEREARRILTDHIRRIGVTIRSSDEEDSIPDWELLEFYEKTHPGEV
jgi:ATP-dependent Lhr-like helicase